MYVLLMGDAKSGIIQWARREAHPLGVDGLGLFRVVFVIRYCTLETDLNDV